MNTFRIPINEATNETAGVLSSRMYAALDEGLSSTGGILYGPIVRSLGNTSITLNIPTVNYDGASTSTISIPSVGNSLAGLVPSSWYTTLNNIVSSGANGYYLPLTGGTLTGSVKVQGGFILGTSTLTAPNIYWTTDGFNIRGGNTGAQSSDSVNIISRQGSNINLNTDTGIATYNGNEIFTTAGGAFTGLVNTLGLIPTTTGVALGNDEFRYNGYFSSLNC
jgi:hypothetical protein